MFAGIFVAIAPVMAMLQADQRPFAFLLLPSPRTTAPRTRRPILAHRLSARIPDNTPTYVVFLQLAGGDPKPLMGAWWARCFDLDGRGRYGGADLYWQRAEPDRPLDRAPTRDRDAELLRLHAVAGLVLIPLFALLTLLPICRC